MRMSVKSDHGSSNGKLKMEELRLSQEMEIASNKEGSSRRKKNQSFDVAWTKQQLLPPQMSTKMKGLLKGLRYISQIFEPNMKKEQEMQIGYPTDVKHVAHVGWDGPSVNNPRWMNEFRSVPDFSSTPLTSYEAQDAKDLPSPRRRSSHGGIRDSPARDAPEVPRPSRRHASVESASGEGTETRRREARRNQSTGDTPDATRRPRRPQSSGLGYIIGGEAVVESPRKVGGGPPSQSQSRQRRSKGSSGSGGRSKPLGSNLSEPDIKTADPLPALTPVVE